MADKNVALRKRQQIENANKRMFLWVAAAAAILGMSAVLSFSLFERIAFNQRVINEKNKTIGILKDNNEIVDELKKNVRVMNTNQALIDTPRIQNAEPLSVILDALPSRANSLALGASLQQKLISQDGVSIESLTVDPISGAEVSEGSLRLQTDAEDNEIAFQFIVSAGPDQADKLKNILRNLEKSIRAINVTSVITERQTKRITMSVKGLAYYQTEKKVELTEKVIKP
jgi:hypothetical protein